MIEMDAASNSGVEDVRNIIQQAKSKSLDSEYKVFIVDECHAISLMGWQAFLKMLEEPPVKSIFIFCTTDPQKIPKTILSRVQRYDFQRISQQGIVDRLKYIITEENAVSPNWEVESIEYIAKIADGGMRDAITLMDKALSYSKNLTLENVVKALGFTNYDIMFQLTDKLVYGKPADMMVIIDDIHSRGKDLKRFIKTYIQFLLDVNKYALGCDWKQLSIPHLKEYETKMDTWLKDNDMFTDLLNAVVKIDNEIKYSASPKYEIEAKMLLWLEGGKE